MIIPTSACSHAAHLGPGGADTMELLATQWETICEAAERLVKDPVAITSAGFEISALYGTIGQLLVQLPGVSLQVGHPVAGIVLHAELDTSLGESWVSSLSFVEYWQEGDHQYARLIGAVVAATGVQTYSLKPLYGPRTGYSVANHLAHPADSRVVRPPAPLVVIGSPKQPDSALLLELAHQYPPYIDERPADPFMPAAIFHQFGMGCLNNEPTVLIIPRGEYLFDQFLPCVLAGLIFGRAAKVGADLQTTTAHPGFDVDDEGLVVLHGDLFLLNELGLHRLHDARRTLN